MVLGEIPRRTLVCYLPLSGKLWECETKCNPKVKSLKEKAMYYEANSIVFGINQLVGRWHGRVSLGEITIFTSFVSGESDREALENLKNLFGERIREVLEND